MKLADQYVNGILYKFDEVPEYRCKSCKRVTLTGLCGCLNQDPIHVSNIFYGTPVTGEVVAINEQ